MNRYILLFRGINVGGNNLLPMKELKLLLERENYQDVKTYIQSGNVVLNSKSAPATDIATKVEQQFGFRPEVLVLSAADFELAASSNPFASFAGKTVHFYFCAQAPILNEQKLAACAAPDEEYQLHGNVFYLHAPSGIGRSKLVANIEACLGVPATGRNLNTVSKLQEMVIDP